MSEKNFNLKIEGREYIGKYISFHPEADPKELFPGRWELEVIAPRYKVNGKFILPGDWAFTRVTQFISELDNSGAI